jgi:hypothetical protein
MAFFVGKNVGNDWFCLRKCAMQFAGTRFALRIASFGPAWLGFAFSELHLFLVLVFA